MKIVTFALLFAALLAPLQAAAWTTEPGGGQSAGALGASIVRDRFAFFSFNAVGLSPGLSIGPCLEVEVRVHRHLGGTDALTDPGIDFYTCASSAVDETHGTCQLVKTPNHQTLTGVYPEQWLKGITGQKLFAKAVTDPGGDHEFGAEAICLR